MFRFSPAIPLAASLRVSGSLLAEIGDKKMTKHGFAWSFILGKKY
jgi:hypothetical protein